MTVRQSDEGEPMEKSKGKELFSREDLKALLLPLFLEQALAVAIGMADTVMVASCGEASVSGVSLVDSISVLLIQVFAALATGGAVVVSQYLGKRDRDQAIQAARHLYVIVALVSLALMALCLLGRNLILTGLFGGIEADVMEAARTYFLLMALSYPFLAIYNAGAALLRSVGDAKSSLYTSLLMNLVNVAGNALTIYGLGMGVMGAGLATLISRMMGALVIQQPMRRPNAPMPFPDIRGLKWQQKMAGMILSIGVPNGLENGMFQFGKLILVRMIATFGTASIAANAVGNTLGTIHCLPGGAISLAMITVVGRCCGAHEFDQARSYTRRLMKTCYLIQGSLNLVILLLNPWIPMAFNLSPEASVLARWVIAIHGVGAITLWPLSFVLPNALRAAGDARFTMIVSGVSMAAFRVIFGWLLGARMGMGVIGVWVAMQIDWVFRIVMFVWRYRSGAWEAKTLM